MNHVNTDTSQPVPRSRATLGFAAALGVVALLSGCGTNSGDNSADEPDIAVIAEGLLNPVGMAQLPDGSILVAEEGTGNNDASAGVSLITVGGQVGRVVSGLPSSRDSGDLSGVPFVAVDSAGTRLYLSYFGAGRILSLAIPPDGFQLGSPAGLDDLTETMTPLNEVRLTNPFDLAFFADGSPVVSDASQNGIATTNPDGTTRFIHRFGELTDPNDSNVRIDAVPTGITRLDDKLLVTLTGGCPFPLGSGQVVSIDGDRNEEVVVDGLNMPIDVSVAEDNTVWVLEFARFTPGSSCFTGEGYSESTGRLSRLDNTSLDVVLDGLNYPGAVLPLSDGSVLVTEVFSGRVIQVIPGSQTRLLPSVAERVEAIPVWQLVDTASESGLSFVHGSFSETVTMDPVAAMGGGLCWLDFDNNGWLDLYMVNSHSESEDGLWEDRGGLPTNALFRNDDGLFTDVSQGSGADLAIHGNGCVAADFNLDGATDIYVTADGPNSLLINNGDGTFSDVANNAGVAAPEWSTAAAVADVNNDGLPDLYVGSYIDLSLKIERPSGAFPQDYIGLPDRLYLNQGNNEQGMPVFADVTAQAGIDVAGRALGALFSDFDRDGDLDLYVTNDGNPNTLYRNDPDSGPLGVTFVDVTAAADVGDSGSGMGVASGDFDGDSSFDLIVTNWDRELNAVYRNRGEDDLSFAYSTFRLGISGLGNAQTGWGTAWADLDNDTDLDLFIVNGRVPVTDLQVDAELVRLYENRLSEGLPSNFRDISETVGLMDVGPLSARGSALADFDNDGDLDIAVNVIGGPAVLLRNNNTPGASIVVELTGLNPGAVVTVELRDGTELVREVHVGSSYLASEDPRLVFGIGDSAGASLIVVDWPDGSTTSMGDVSPGARVVFAPPT